VAEGTVVVAQVKRNLVRDLRSASSLSIEAIQGIAAVVEAMQEAQIEGLGPLGRPLAPISNGLRKVSFGTLRGVTELVGHLIDRGLAPLELVVGDQASVPWLDALVAVLNGVVGDYLTTIGSPLAISMELRYGGAPLLLEPNALSNALPKATGKLLVLVHGSCLSDGQWKQSGHDHGEALARDLGYTPVYVRYNSGLHISTNGEALANLLEPLLGAWPTPIEDFVLLGHSMGGLVARAACRAGEAAPHHWRTQLRKLICLGTPHHGAPYERAGNWVDIALGISPYSAPLAKLGKIRSAGVTDLRYGYVVDDDWKDRDRFERGEAATLVPLPAGVDCYAIAGSFSDHQDPKPRSDGLVPVESALGQADDPTRTLAFPRDHQAIVGHTGHLALLGAPDVYHRLRRWLSGDVGVPTPS
jgi:pimeloyl-ACP methyl ester carboxylesterase